MKNKKIELDCRECVHCTGHGCKKFGDDPDEAIKKCARTAFRTYRKAITVNKELKPCPFCGGEAGVSERYDEYCAVRCITCGAKTNFSMTKKGAIELWNRREPIDKIVEQLEELNEEEERFVNNHVFIQGIIEIVKGGAV